jgi:hypothetical protein
LSRLARVAGKESNSRHGKTIGYRCLTYAKSFLRAPVKMSGPQILTRNCGNFSTDACNTATVQTGNLHCGSGELIWGFFGARFYKHPQLFLLIIQGEQVVFKRLLIL